MDLLAIIPCRNEAAAIGPLVTEVRRHVHRVLVMDDASTDGSGGLARAAGAEVLAFPTNRGKGAALVAGLREARARGCAWALLLDGDGQHAPEDIPAFLDVMRSDRADLVVGNRMATPGAMPFPRRLFNRVMSATLSALTGTSLPDSQCGFRLLRLAAWAPEMTRCARFEIESEMLVSFLADHRRVEFIPVRSLYKSEQSKIHPLRDTLRWFRWLFRSRGTFARVRRGAKRSPDDSRARADWLSTP